MNEDQEQPENDNNDNNIDNDDDIDNDVLLYEADPFIHHLGTSQPNNTLHLFPSDLLYPSLLTPSLRRIHLRLQLRLRALISSTDLHWQQQVDPKPKSNNLLRTDSKKTMKYTSARERNVYCGRLPSRGSRKGGSVRGLRRGGRGFVLVLQG
jgi:hypothetical protein